jgi:hypothetical protein
MLASVRLESVTGIGWTTLQMGSNASWTAEQAASDFVRLLQQARERGPQQITDETGVFVLQAVPASNKVDVAKSLLELRSKG